MNFYCVQLLILVAWFSNTMATAAVETPAGSSDNAVAETRTCRAQWVILSSQRNRPGEQEFIVRLAYTSGPKDQVGVAGETASPEGPQYDTKLVGLTVRLRSSSGSKDDASIVSAEMSGPELSRAFERSLSVTVPARGSIVTVWQLVVTTGEGEQLRRYGFENTAVTSGGLEPPDRVVDCHARYWTRALIGEDTLVRLKNIATGKYLVMTLKRGWEAATLGYSKEYRYRLKGVGISGPISNVRIEAETQVFGGYKYAYASMFGRIYFNVLMPYSESQLWTLSNPYPRDGDHVVIKNVRWPFASLVHNNRSTTDSVYCMYRRYPDKWLLEIA